ncbi:UbiA family prenyltransferase [Streptomyces decoyicus]|uniref:UbiA family prenyltransferase n=1 Tax=Streptomyces decoyicus TaxID=249567 RepID=A0ABZ1FVB2_9ACTN|nr:UbiA family prenyltransferase [Streptomyces decoyicus]WSB74096.1 UbiA family prenyltransferase [Streptomyces decoyicus]
MTSELPAARGEGLRSLVRIHRLEYPFPVIYLCHVLWGACLAATGPGSLTAAPVLIMLFANIVAIISQNPLNAGLDIRADTHTSGKESIARATQHLSVRTAFTCAALEMALALGLSVWVALWLGRPLVAVGVALSIVLHLAYNLEPVRLKRRGYANPAYFGATFAFLPSLSTYAAVRADVPLSAWLFLTGLGILLFGRSLWWCIPDLIGDAKAGDRTPAVQHGPRHALVVACAWTALGLLFIGAGLWPYGVLWALLGILASAAFLVDKIKLLRHISRENLPHESTMRKHSLSLAMGGDLLLCAIPLLAL